MTLVSSAIRNDLDVWSYVKGVLDALLSGSEDYASLRPDAWAATHPEQKRAYRIAERKDRDDRDGLAIWYKRLEAGTFERVRGQEGPAVKIDATELSMLLGGMSLDAARRRKRFTKAA